jgi:thiol-disulfide isomerase/thioredoxin
MKFLNINSSNYNDKNESNVKLIDDLNNSIQNNKKVFLLVYLIGCGPCNATRPEWKKIENVLGKKYKNNNEYIVVDIDQSLMPEIKNLKDTPNSFPSIRYIQGDKYQPYTNGRDVDSFINWIEGEMKQSGGTKIKNKSTKNKSTKNKSTKNKSKKNKTRRRLYR